MNKKSVFVSYSHKDVEFTRRLCLALSLYMNVFWDRDLLSGEFSEQLLQQIETSDHFLLVVSSNSVKSDWCMKELTHAEHNYKPIALAMHQDPSTLDVGELTSRYTYGAFYIDFEQGFRRITAMMSGEAVSSWEALIHADKTARFEYLKSGLIPGNIAKELIDWLLVERVWGEVKKYAATLDGFYFGINPYTALGVIEQAQSVKHQFETRRDGLGMHLTQQIVTELQGLVEKMSAHKDREHLECGKTAFQIYETVQNMLIKNAVGFRDTEALLNVRKGGAFEAEVSEKLRQLIALDARRSRYTY